MLDELINHLVANYYIGRQDAEELVMWYSEENVVEDVKQAAMMLATCEGLLEQIVIPSGICVYGLEDEDEDDDLYIVHGGEA